MLDPFDPFDAARSRDAWTTLRELRDAGPLATVAGGKGGNKSGHDGVGRSALEPMPGSLMGWLDVDTYFDGWASPSDIYDSDDDDDPYK